jgi:Spy/CpxP family protein refolding chaperone
MKRKLLTVLGLIALAVSLLVLTVGGAVRQHKGGPGGHPPFGPPNPEAMLSHMTEALSLTSDQVTQIKAIMTDEQSRTEQYRTKLADLDQQLHAATANGQFDEAKVRDIASQQAAAMTELIVERERGKARTYAVLTPDQQTKFDQMRPAGPPPGAGKMGFGPRPGW